MRILQADSAAQTEPIRPYRGDDLLLSFTVIGGGALREHWSTVEKHASRTAQAFRFVELLVVTDSRPSFDEGGLAGLARIIPQLRHIQVDGVRSYDQLARVACQECIGDVLVVAAGDELETIDPVAIAAELAKGCDLVFLRRPKSTMTERAIGWFVRVLTGLNVDLRNFRSIGMSRVVLSDIVSRGEGLDLIRFLALSGSVVPSFIEVDVGEGRRGISALRDRAGLLGDLVEFAAPRLLRLMAATAIGTAGLSLLFLLYVALIVLFKSNIAEGWITTSVIVSVLLFFQAVTASLLCLGVARLLSAKEASSDRKIIGETSASDLFRNFSDINVERANGAKR